jgi:hypothetical protein
MSVLSITKYMSNLFFCRTFQIPSGKYLPSVPTLRILPIGGRREVSNFPQIGLNPVRFFDYADLAGGEAPPETNDDERCNNEKTFVDMGLETSAGHYQTGGLCRRRL